MPTDTGSDAEEDEGRGTRAARCLRFHRETDRRSRLPRLIVPHIRTARERERVRARGWEQRHEPRQPSFPLSLSLLLSTTDDDDDDTINCGSQHELRNLANSQMFLHLIIWIFNEENSRWNSDVEKGRGRRSHSCSLPLSHCCASSAAGLTATRLACRRQASSLPSPSGRRGAAAAAAIERNWRIAKGMIACSFPSSGITFDLMIQREFEGRRIAWGSRKDA